MFEQPFALPSADAFAVRQCGSEFDEPVIEQRLARLQPNGHTGPINLGQDIAGEPEFQVGILRAVQAGTRRRITHHLDQWIFCTVIAADLQEGSE